MKDTENSSQKRDLSKEKIINLYIKLTHEIGLNKVSFPRIAEKLEVKTPSLYNHFKNLDDLKIQTAIYLHQELNELLMKELVGKSKGEALLQYALTYRTFSKKFSSVYELLNTIPLMQNTGLSEAGAKSNQVLTKLLTSFDLSEEKTIVKSRSFRSMLHGYITLNQLGYFQNPRMDDDESFNLMIEEFISEMK
ncbi:TetR/AcrR family transcriptional regulator [Enterococcus hermanniensis]|uniref:Transcriptional regulator n=1 Tax=Enterococcus hermanniensis TaxID=249189 RepID=A0A1L8TP54_9ENTE|nr:TetR-like C-terminal domain-containing protein [Enterococcus hermanniensis]OJG46115.1 transcriptional regulator [Enterococcus hermanniensis]